MSIPISQFIPPSPLPTPPPLLSPLGVRMCVLYIRGRTGFVVLWVLHRQRQGLVSV